MPKAMRALRISLGFVAAFLILVCVYELSYALANSLSVRGYVTPRTVDALYRPLPGWLKHDVILACWRKLDRRLARLAPYEASLRAEKGGIKYNVRYGYRDGRLFWIIFESTVSEFRYPADIRPIPGGFIQYPTPSIALPDGTTRDLANSRMMFQFSGQAFTNRPIDVTLNQFSAFLASMPKKYSIEKLEEYVHK